MGAPRGMAGVAVPDTPLVEVIGDRSAKDLAKNLDLHTVADLLGHYPRRYVERGELTDLSRVRLDEEVTVSAGVKSVKGRRLGGPAPGSRRGRHLLEVLVTDGHGTLRLTFFNQAFREADFVPGRQGLFAGKVTEFNGARQMVSPEYIFFDGGASKSGLDEADVAAGFLPVYPATKNLPTWKIAAAVRVTLDRLDPLPDPLPPALRARHRLVDRDTATRRIHRPEGWPDVATAQKRLKFDEALRVQLVLARRRHEAAGHPAVPREPVADGVGAAFDAALPFELTAGQRDVGEVLSRELAGTHPMQRLLQGEVGSGKTVVALRAMLQAVDSGGPGGAGTSGQAALLAPTEVLAAQHARSIEAMLGPLAHAGRIGGAERATRVTLLLGSGAQNAATRRRALLEVASGEAGIVIGTHALIQEKVSFADLGLVVVDEQHRFGVEQRDALRAKAARPPHVLVMTATPIPRTVAMTVFGDLEISTLSELPAGRAPISTSVVPLERPAWLERAWHRIREEAAAGHRAYVVCPQIGDAPDDDASGDEPADLDTDDEPRVLHGVLKTAAELAEGPLAGLRIGVLHGRLDSDTKDDVMSRFAAGELDVLVATTVIEVGVDVPEASVMVVLDAERFGVSQLHQLRGRVGRGGLPGLCLLVTSAPPDTPARERLDAVAATTDGFVLAELDLEQRREGDVLGASQSGRSSGLRLLSLVRDRDLITEARDEARSLVEEDPTLAATPLLAGEVDALMSDERAEYLEKS